MNTASFDLSHEFTASSTGRMDLTEASFSIRSGVAGDIPLVIPRDQLYYWSRAWQEAEQRNVDELRRGEGRTFSTADDALRWLFSGDE